MVIAMNNVCNCVNGCSCGDDCHIVGEEDNLFMYYSAHIYDLITYISIASLVSLGVFETIGRRRDGIGWQIRDGSTWWRRSRRGRDRKIKNP